MSKGSYANVPPDVQDEEDLAQLSHDSFELDDINSLDYETSETQENSTLNNGDDFGFESVLEVPQLNKSNLKMAFMNMANSILGAGAIGLPFAISNTGIVGGVFSLSLLTVLVDFTMQLIIINMKLSGKSGYQDTVKHCFGKTGKLIIILSQALFAFGGSIGFCMIIGDTIPHILRSFFPSYETSGFLHFLFARNTVIIIVTATISFPLSLTRDISKLAKASALALVSMLIIILIVLIRGPELSPEFRGKLDTSTIFITPRIFQGISVISFALVCHHNTSFIFHSLKKPSLNQFAILTHMSCLVSLAALTFIGFGGFAVFKDKTKGNILNNFPGNDFVVNIARFCFGFNMLTTYPLEIFVLRDVLKDLYFLNYDTPQELSTKSHTIFTTILVLVTMGVSLSTCNLGALFELIGASTASIIAFILPPLCNLKMTGSTKTFKQKFPYIACIVFGFAVMFISSTQTIIKAIREKDSASHCST